MRGLDFALLEREKARIAASSSEEPARSETDDADLEAALAEGKSMATRAAHRVQAQAAHKANFRRIDEPVEAPDVIYINGKRMRKKKKTGPSQASTVPGSAGQLSTKQESKAALSSAEPVSNEGSQANTQSTQGTEHDSRALATRGDAATSLPWSDTTETTSSRPRFAVEVDDADADIFGEAGVWEGLSDEEPGTRDAAPSRAEKDTPQCAVQRDWFHESLSEAREADVRTAATDSHPTAATNTNSPKDDDKDTSATSPPTRLEGLSTSALPSDVSRWLLEREEKHAAHAERREPQQQRKRKRSKKGRGGGGDSP